MKLIKIMYPDRCPLCDTARPLNETGICPDCKDKLKKLEEPFCPLCGREMKSRGKLCRDCITGLIYYDGGQSGFCYSGLKDSIYKFKYMNRSPYARDYASLLFEVRGAWLLSLKADALVPVPLHKKRLIKRGYNQATELAMELSHLSGIPVEDKLIMRARNTVPQKLMNRVQRKSNMKKAFIVRGNVVNLRRVIIVDDIFTTGSTVNSMALELKAAGIKEVFFITLARAGT